MNEINEMENVDLTDNDNVGVGNLSDNVPSFDVQGIIDLILD